MRIKHTPKKRQPELFPVEFSGSIDTGGALRVRSGARIEDVVCRALRLTPISISGSYDVCYDAGTYHRGKEIFFEIKSLRKHNKSPLYVFRLKKDVKATKQCGVPLIYAFCIHNIESGCESQEEITKSLLSHPIQINLLPLSQVIELTKDLPLKQIKSDNGTNGYNREGYADGYKNLSQKTISSVCKHSVTRHIKIGEKRKPVSIRISSELDVEIPKWMRGGK